MSDWELIQEYAESRSEEAFAELVRRHLSWIYSLALRKVRQPQMAEEVAQSVFVLLARKAGGLRSGTVLSGWLFRTTCFIASRALRSELRLKTREHSVSSMTPAITLPEDKETAWEMLSPHLDEAVQSLSEQDRIAILLRFYEKKPLQKIGDHLGVNEEAAKKRVSRAVEKLRSFLVKRGVTLGSTVLVSALAGKTVEAAPLALEATVLKAATAGVSASAVLPQLVRETLAAWRWTKIKLAAGLLLGGLTAIFIAINAPDLLDKQNASSRGAAANSATSELANSAPGRAGDAVSGPRANPPARLQKTGPLAGLVMDIQGHTIEGARVWGGFSQRPFAVDTTDASGQFALDKADGPPFVTVTADGFAADQQQFDPTNPSAELVFRLRPIQPLDVRLVDEAGKGVPGVRLFLSHWWGRSGTLAQSLPQVSDSEGSLRWLSPPRGELTLEFAKSGYRFSRTNRFAADGGKHTVVLRPAGALSGTVTDAESGALVTNFEFTAGHSQPWVLSDPTPLWDLQSRTASNGVYQMAIEEEQIPYLRIQADGYETVEAQIQLTNGLEAVRDFQLKRLSLAHSIQGTVLLSDGIPAAGVEVALCTAQVGVMLSGTAFEQELFGNTQGLKRADYRTVTDSQGRFWFAPKPTAHTVVAVGFAGLGKARCSDFSKPLEIRLEPWGRITGKIRTRDHQWVSRAVNWSHTGPLTSWMTLFYDAKGFSTVSDASGNFILEHVPPGDCHVEVGDGSGTTSIFSPSIRVEPGQTAEVQIGGTGRPVVGRLIAPVGVEIRSWPRQVTFSELHVEWADYHIPQDLKGDAIERWKLEFEDTKAGQTWFRDQYAYSFKVEEDGSFSIPEVLPGQYRLFINVAQGYLGSGLDSNPRSTLDPRIASTSIEVTVPVAGESGSPVDLGDIVLVADQ